MEKVITTNFECKYKKDKDKRFATTNILGTTKQQQLVHINIPSEKIHTEEPILYSGLTVIVRDGSGILCIGDESMFIRQNDIIMIGENKGFRIWSRQTEMNIYIIYSTQVYPDNKKGIRRKCGHKYSLNVVSGDTQKSDDIDTACGIFSNCSK